MTQIWAHRGASGYCPENTIEAFEKAIEMNSDGIELDVQLTKDGQIVVCHDELIDRVSNHKGFLKDFTYEELASFNFNNKMDEKYPFCKIPLLSQVLEMIKPTKLVLNIELKTSVFHYEGIEQKVVDMVKEYGLEDRIIYSSFNHQSIVNLLNINPQANCGFLHSDGIIDICEMKYSKDQYAITSDYSRELVRKREVFVAVTGTRKAIHSVMVTAEGVVHNAEWGEIQAEVTMDDLYE